MGNGEVVGSGRKGEGGGGLWRREGEEGYGVWRLGFWVLVCLFNLVVGEKIVSA